MFLAAVNHPRQFVYFGYFGHVTAEQLRQETNSLETLLKDLAPGFRVLADLARVEDMDLDCVPEIGRTMEILDRHQVGLIVRVVPDGDKDIGFNIIAAFHYQKRPQTATCRTMDEAARLLGF